MTARPPAPRAILFDWDNTLVDSWPPIHAAMNAALAAMGHPAWTPEDTRARVRRSLREAFPDLFGDRWEEARDIFYDSFQAHHLETLAARPGAAEMLAEIAGRGVYLGVVSNKTGSYLRREAAHLGWTDFFGRLIGANDAARDKPAIEPVALALADSGVDPGPDVWFVGDTAIDMLCARNAGCFAVLVGDLGPEAPEFAGQPPDLVFQEFTAFRQVVRGLI